MVRPPGAARAVSLPGRQSAVQARRPPRGVPRKAEAQPLRSVLQKVQRAHGGEHPSQPAQAGPSRGPGCRWVWGGPTPILPGHKTGRSRGGESPRPVSSRWPREGLPGVGVCSCRERGREPPREDGLALRGGCDGGRRAASTGSAPVSPRAGPIPLGTSTRHSRRPGPAASPGVGGSDPGPGLTGTQGPYHDPD